MRSLVGRIKGVPLLYSFPANIHKFDKIVKNFSTLCLPQSWELNPRLNFYIPALLYLDDSILLDMATLSVSNSSVAPHPEGKLSRTVSGLVDGNIIICGGEAFHLVFFMSC